MTEGTQVALLRRMTRSQGEDVAVNPLTSSRAVRLALIKAANDKAGLAITVQSVGEEVTDLEDMLGSLGDDLMFVGLWREGALVGLIALDVEMRAAVQEMETMGAVLTYPAEPRAPTRTDKMLCDPLIAEFLSAFPTAVLGTPLEGWLDGIAAGDRVDSTRAAGLVLEDRDYRVVRLSVDLGVTERQAELIIVLPLVKEEAANEPPLNDGPDWDTAFQSVVADAPAQLQALLHRFPVSLATAQALQVGSVLPLPGCTVNSVRLMSSDGTEFAQAKLGQVGGYRAVRLESAPQPELSELPNAAPEISSSAPDMLDVDDLCSEVGVADDMPAMLDQPMDLNLIDENTPQIAGFPGDQDQL